MTRFRTKDDDSNSDAPIVGDDVFVLVDQAVNPYIVLFHDPGSYRSEQFRGLRNQLVAMNPDGAPKTLVVTSAIKGEGKSITAINLALAFAELERHSVVLVDADLRQPSVESSLNLAPGRGLGDLLMDRARVSDVVRTAGFRDLAVVGTGTRVTSPSEVLTSARIDDLFARLKEQYRYIVVDTPPVLPSTDASVISARADGTLLAVRLEYSPKSMTKEAIRMLQDLGGNVLGVFVTEVRGADPERDPRLAYRNLEDL